MGTVGSTTNAGICMKYQLKEKEIKLIRKRNTEEKIKKIKPTTDKSHGENKVNPTANHVTQNIVMEKNEKKEGRTKTFYGTALRSTRGGNQGER